MSITDSRDNSVESAQSPPMDEETRAFAVTLFAALAHPTRLSMVELLTDGGRTVNEVAQALGLLQPNASQHLAILHRAGVVRVSRAGAVRCYSLRGPRIARILVLVDEVRHVHATDLESARRQERSSQTGLAATRPASGTGGLRPAREPA